MRFFLLFSVLLATLLSNASAQKVRVITRNLEPFSFQQDGKQVGFAMELWDNVAKELNLESEVALTDSAKHIVEAVQNKTADVGVGALSITAEREKVIDFSQPFYDSGLQIVVSTKEPSALDTAWSLLSSFLNWQFIGSFALLILAMLVISHLVWMFEHKVNEEMWPKHYLSGMWESFWWSISTLLVGGADNKGPVGIGGRIVAIVWMLLSIVLIALLTGSFAANLTVDKMQSDINGPDDLRGKAVATVGGSASETWLNAHEANVQTFANIGDCLAALKKATVKAVVYDAPILKYELTKSHEKGLAVVGPLFDPTNYGFALAQDSALRERINQALLTLHESGVTEKIREKYFGKPE